MEEKKLPEAEESPSYKTFKDKLKSMMNRSQIADVLTLFFVIILTTVMSLLSVGWDITKISWNTYIVNLTFLIFLGIFGLFYGEKTGRTFFKSYIIGAYQRVKRKFKEIKDKIINKSYTDALPDYLIYRYKKDYENECKKMLVSVKVFDTRVLDLPENEFLELQHNPITSERFKNDEYPCFDKLSEKQFELVKKVREGTVELDYIDDHNFYLMNDTNGSGEKLVRRIINSEKRKRKIELRQRSSKLLLIVLFSAVFAGVFVDTLTGQSASQTWMNLFSRMTTLLTSVVAGFNTARLLNNIDIEILEYKTSYLQVFYASLENKTYIPSDYKEIAKKHYEEYKKEQEESKKNIVEPEVLQIEDKTIYK